MSLKRAYDPISVTILRNPDIFAFSGPTLLVPGDPVSSLRGQTDVGIVLSMRLKRALFVGIPVNNLSCTVWLDGSVYFSGSRLKRRSLFAVSVYGPTYCGSPELYRLPGSEHSTNIVVVADGFDAQLGMLTARK